MIASSMCIVILLLVYLCFVKGKLINDLSLMMTASVFLVSLFFPVLSMIVEPVTWRNLDGIDSGNLSYLQWQYFFFLLGCVIFTAFFGYKVDLVKQVESPRSSGKGFSINKREFFSLTLIVVGGTLYGYFILSVGINNLIAIDVLSDKYEAASGKGIFYIGLNFIILGILIAEHNSVSKKFRFFCRAAAICVIVWALAYIHTRTYAAILLLGYFSIYITNQQILISSIRFKYITWGLVLWLFLEMFSIGRSFISAGYGMQLAEMKVYLVENVEETIGAVVGGSDFSHPFITFWELSMNEEAGSLLGQGFLDGIKSVLPSVLVGDKPATTAQWFVNKYYPDFAARGGGAASSLVGEIWLNFGAYVGPFIFGILISFLIFIIQLNAKRNENGLCSFLIPYLTLYALLFERAGLVATFKQTIYIIVPLTGLYFCFILLKNVGVHHMETNR